MKARTTFILLLLAAVVGLLVVASELWWSNGAGDGDAGRKNLFKFKPDDVVRIEVRGSGASATFLRLSGGADWVLETPRAPVDPYELKCMIDVLSNLREEGRVKAADVTGQSESVFGLKEPRLVLAVKTAKESWQLTVGNDAPIAEKVYARVGGDRDVVMIGAGIVGTFSKPALRFRDKRIARFESYKLRAAEIHTPAHVVKLERRGNMWMVTAPYEDYADMRALDELFRMLQDCNAERFEADELAESDFARFGVAKEGWKSARVVLTLSDTEKPVEILFGDQAADVLDLVFARNMSFPNVYSVKSSVLDVLKTPPGAFRSRSVFFFNPDNAWKVQIRNSKILAEAEKMPIVSWVPRVPTGYNFDNRRVDSFLGQLAMMQAEQIVAEKIDDPDKYSLLVPAYNVTISLEEQIGGAPVGGGKSDEQPVFQKREVILHVGIVEGRVFGHVEGQSKVVALPAAFAEMLARGHLNFMGLGINEIYTPDVESVEFTMGEKCLRVCPTENLGWTVAESRNLKAPVRGIEEAANAFRSLSAADIIADKIQRPCPWIDSPYLVIKATLRSDPPSVTPNERKLIVSTKEAGSGRHLACIEGEDFVYVLEEGKVVAMTMPLTGQ